MKDKHLHIAEDSELLASIYQAVEKHLNMNSQLFMIKIGFKFIIYFAFSAISYSFLYTVVNPIYFVLSFILYGFVSLLFAFNFSHDFSHNTVFKNKRLNHICFVCIYTIVGAHAEAWKERHVHSHHHAPNVGDYDSDLKITKLIRVIPNSEYCWYHRYQYIYAPFAYTIYSLFWIFVKDFVILFSKDEYTQRKGFQYHLAFWLQKSFYVAIMLILPLLFSQQIGYMVLIGFLLMHLTQSLFLLFTFFMAHHVEATAYPTTNENGYINTSWVMNQIQSSNDMHPFSETANFMLGGFNNHIAHHLFPHIHHLYYPAINRILYPILLKNNIQPNYTTYWGGVVSHLKLLKRMGYAENKSISIAKI